MVNVNTLQSTLELHIEFKKKWEIYLKRHYLSSSKMSCWKCSNAFE